MRKEDTTAEKRMGLATSQVLQALQNSLVNLAGAKRLDQTVIINSQLLAVHYSALNVPGVDYNRKEIRVSIQYLSGHDAY